MFRRVNAEPQNLLDKQFAVPEFVSSPYFRALAARMKTFGAHCCINSLFSILRNHLGSCISHNLPPCLRYITAQRTAFSSRLANKPPHCRIKAIIVGLPLKPLQTGTLQAANFFC
ncbi:MAG: hypothetical protein FWB82_04200, partial [Treponema sp.]|nr:hypothetical protein [Treponema sp.]